MKMTNNGSTIRCYRVLVDGVPVGDKMSLDVAMVLIEGLCNKWFNDSFTITLEQRQAVVELEKEKTNE